MAAPCQAATPRIPSAIRRPVTTGELHAVSRHWAWGNHVQYSLVGVDGRVRRIVDIPVGGPESIHDMTRTTTCAVKDDLPFAFTPEALAEGLAFSYRWSHNYEGRVGLLPLEGGAEDVVY